MNSSFRRNKMNFIKLNRMKTKQASELQSDLKQNMRYTTAAGFNDSFKSKCSDAEIPIEQAETQKQSPKN